jgi:two-component system cell cycle response regulator DivK
MTDSTPFILCIEDDETSRFILYTLLNQVMDYTNAQIWPDSVDFERRIESLEEIPQLIILDIKMVPIDGFEMLRLLRKNEAFQDTKIVAFTAGVMPEQVNQLKDAGFDGLISKPIIRQLFPKIIGSLLAGESIWYIS